MEWIEPPDTSDDEALVERAADEVFCTPADLATWLGDECGDDTSPLDDAELRRTERELSVPELLAALFNDSDHKRIVAHVIALREKAADGLRDRIAERAREIEAEAAEEAAEAAFDAEMDRRERCGWL